MPILDEDKLNCSGMAAILARKEAFLKERKKKMKYKNELLR